MVFNKHAKRIKYKILTENALFYFKSKKMKNNVN